MKKQFFSFQSSNCIKETSRLLFIGVLFLAQMGFAQQISFTKSDQSFALVNNGIATTIVVDANDFEVVKTVASHFQNDVALVSKVMPLLQNTLQAKTMILVGTMEKSSFMKQLIADKKLDVKVLEGQWERYIYQVVSNPFPGVESALVICGSDRRGAAYGVFDLSKQMGVSPLYWWSDIPVKQHQEVFVNAEPYLSNAPDVKYRGIFINDEQWGIGPWASKVFEPEVGTLGPKTYAKVFEMMLRLKANYIWPSMKHKKAFYQVAGNKEMADKYAIVMGSSHHEPLHVNTSLEWNKKTNGPWQYDINKQRIDSAWNGRVKETADYENIYTMGMRGAEDKGMEGDLSVDEQAKLLRNIISNQRDILKKYHKQPLTDVPQVLTVYKEVLKLYNEGLEVPDDMTIVWTDDNYGYIQQLNSWKEKGRKGGTGVYYHLDYLGRPQSYVWLATVHPMLIWKELNKAFNTGANRLWVFNVGDIKPHEQQIEYCMDLAWDFPANKPETALERMKNWFVSYLGSELGEETYNVMMDYYQLAFERKPDFMGWDRLEPATPVVNTEYSYHNDGELRRRMERFNVLEKKMQDIYAKVPAESKSSFYELAYYHVLGSKLMNDKMLYAQLNRMYAKQGRALTNEYALKSKIAFDSIKLITENFRKLENGKWNEIMSWWSFNYSYMPPVDSIAIPNKALMGIDFDGNDPDNGTKSINSLPLFSSIYNDHYSFEVYNKGSVPFKWQACSDRKWLKIEKTKGTCHAQERINVSVDWAIAPIGSNLGNITLKGAGSSVLLQVPVFNCPKNELDSMQGRFVEKDGVVAINAAHFSKANSKNEYQWTVMDRFGQAGNVVTILPDTLRRIGHDWDLTKNAPSLEYEFYTFSTGWVNALSFTLPSHPINKQRGCLYAVAIDNQPPKIIDFSTRDLSETWKQNVQRNSAIGESKHFVAKAGKHVFKVWAIDPDVVFDRFIINLGGLRKSYLGPLETKME